MNAATLTRNHNSLGATARVTYAELKDFDLVRLCQSRDKFAFEELMKRHQRTVMAILYRLAPNWSDSADLAQEAFIRMWRGIDRLQNPKAFKSWMTQIVTNLFYDELRKRPRNTFILSLDAPIGSEDENQPTRDVPDPAAGPDEVLHRKHLIKSVETAIAALPHQFRTALELREVEDMPYEEIARLTQSDLGTVKSRISRARSKVQKVLRAEFRPDQAA
jgi:RNA polymerase sigma-70 factor, ECF subfamily